jgi:hypothetical protein
MADKTVETEEKPEEEPKPQETPMADQVDWRKAAENAGYALVPAADLNTLKSASEELKNLRSIFPEEARGKEAGFVNTLRESAGKVKEYEEQLGSVEALKQENTELKSTNEGLVKGKKLSDMWGHISRVQQMRNVRVHDRFIDESKLTDFPLDKFDLSKEKGIKDFAESVWKDVLEPAHKEQTTVIEQVHGPARRDPDADDPADRRGRDDREEVQSLDTPPSVFGGLA